MAGRLDIVSASTLMLLLFAMMLPFAAADNAMTIGLETHRQYYNSDLGAYVNSAAFHLFGGEHVQWWQGGAVFIYYVNNSEARAKIDTLTRGLMTLFRDLGFITVAGTVKPTHVSITYVYSGVVEYEGIYFVDTNGTIRIEWSEGKPLTIVIRAIAAVNASTAKYYGRADWRRATINGGTAVMEPEITVHVPQGCREYEFLAVPVEGVAASDEGIETWWGDSSRIYLGGGPELTRITADAPGWTLHDSPLWYGRYIALAYVYIGGERIVFSLDRGGMSIELLTPETELANRVLMNLPRILGEAL
jgi:hypothetical protein